MTGQLSLFGVSPDPRPARTYAEQCLAMATKSPRRGWETWADYRDGGLSDADLFDLLSEWTFNSDPSFLCTGMQWDAIGGPGLRLIAIRDDETELAAHKRKPDYQGAGLVLAVRVLHGIGRPA